MNEQREISLKFTNKVTGESKLERYADQLNKIKATLGGIDIGIIKTIEDSSSDITKISKNTEKMSKLAGVAFNYTTLRTLSRGMKTLTTTMAGLVTQSSSFLEDFNLFQVAFHGNYQSAEKFVNKLSEMYGLDEGWLTRTTGIFKQLANAMDLSTESGEKLSELMTQMSVDISSLYNVDVDRASQVLQSALAGQTKPIRSLTGGDITQATLQTTLDKMGIDRAISDLSFAEKRLMIIVSLTQQLSESAGDWGRTLESPANQTRILNEQWTRLTRAVGNLFLPIVAKILPYLNAILMVLTKIINKLASLLGFKIDNYDYFGETAGSAWDLDDAVSSAGDSVDNLKKKMSGLRGFDKLNVITTPSDSGKSSGGGAGAGGIDPRILDAFNLAFDEYQKKLDDVKMKAREIAEAFEYWAKCLLPLEKPLKEIDGLTYSGLIYVWENVLKPLGKWIADDLIPTAVKTIASGLELIYKIGQNLFKIYKVIYENIVLPFARSIGNAIINSLEGTAKLLETISKSKVATNVLALVLAFKNLKNIITILLKTKIGKEFGAFSSLLLDNVKGVKSLRNIWKNFFTLVTPNLNKYKSGISKLKQPTVTLTNAMKSLKTAVAGAIVAFAGFEVLKGSLEDISKNGLKVGNVLGVVAGTIATVAGALTTLNAITAIFGVTLTSLPIVGWIAGLTAVAGAIAGIILSTNEFNSTSKDTKQTLENLDASYDALDEKLKNVKSSYDDMLNSFNENYQAKLVEIENSKTYIDSLDDIVDGNFRVKSGYEEVAETILNGLNEAYGTELTLEDGVIKNNSQIIKDKQTLINITDEYAEAIKKQILLEGYQAMYKDAINQQMEAKTAYNKTVQETNKTIEETIKKLESNKITANEADKILEKAQKRQDKAQKDYNKTIDSTGNIIDNLGKVTKTYSTGTSEELQKTINEITKTSDKSKKEVDSSYEKWTKKLKDSISKVKKEHEEALKKFQSKNNVITYEMRIDDTSARRTYNKFARDVNSASSSSSVSAGLWCREIPSIGVHANGGLPPVGQLFIANERGPELVGQIGGQSFVANQNQMMDLLDRKIGNAQNNSKPQVFNIYLDSNHKIGTYTLEQLQDMAKTNGKPITIGY